MLRVVESIVEAEIQSAIAAQCQYSFNCLGYFRYLKRPVYIARLKRNNPSPRHEKNHHDKSKNFIFLPENAVCYLSLFFFFNSQLFTTNLLSINEGNVGTQCKLCKLDPFVSAVLANRKMCTFYVSQSKLTMQ